MGCDSKLEAARGALSLVKSLGPPRSLGLGTGSTVESFIEESIRAGLLEGARIACSSKATLYALVDRGYSVEEPESLVEIDVYVDGADEADTRGALIKGGGGALLGEKVLAYSSRINIFAVGEEKLSSLVGSRSPVPLEAVRDYALHVVRAVKGMGYEAEVRRGSGKRGPIVSDWGGVIIDVRTGPIEDPESLASRLKRIPGVVETGLFTGLADYLVIGYSGCGWRILEFKRYRL